MGRQSQTAEETETDTLKLEDESLNTSKAGATVPLQIGEARTAIRWLTPIYGQRVVKQPSKSGK